jgi:hypothetical protein
MTLVGRAAPLTVACLAAGESFAYREPVGVRA